jgi:Zn-dependent M28 family amino/carboxypeptidase
MTGLKIVWALLFVCSLFAYVIIFFGAATGGSDNAWIMFFLWGFVLAGVAAGALAVFHFLLGIGPSWLGIAAALFAIWPLFAAVGYLAMRMFR